MAARGQKEQSIPRVGLRHTLRFQATTEDYELQSREFFGKQVIIGQLQLKVEEVHCIQWNQQEKAFDVTLRTEDIYRSVTEICRAQAGVRPLAGYKVLNLDRPNFRTITVHMYNPFVNDSALAAFLGQYGEVVTAARHIKDTLGFWTGRRQYQVLLYHDAEGPGGLKHPPAFFSLGGDRGYLFYPRQPAFCRKCRQSGHAEAGCGEARCRFCGQAGHSAKDCTEPRTCHGCGGTDHLYRGCPGRKKTFAEAAKPTEAGEPSRGTTHGQKDGERTVQEGSGADTSGSKGEVAPRDEGTAGTDEMAQASTDSMDGFPVLTSDPAPSKSKQGARKVSQAFGTGLSTELGGSGEGVRSKKSKGGQTNKGGIEGGRGEGTGQHKRAADKVEEEGAQQQKDGDTGQEVGGEVCEQSLGEADAILAEGLGLSFDLPPGLLMLSSPLGEDAYEGLNRPTTSPNAVPFSWADEMDKENVYL
ncbi:hypothetical protein VZT92_026550 [Zoarces viviparus]|uniref:CCHC-type domain-containing protein n=1 Tax=Zoarces viviparus TaxID=48416 RepID=A0AAW1E0C6_ZOAVI